MSTLAGLLDRLRTEPSRTGSMIVTVYGDAILPRGGEAAMADLLVLMRRLGAAEGVVRTAVSRLARDGWLEVLVADDGVGGADIARGTGLRGLADRVESLGGTLAVSDGSGGGTTVHARIPLDQGMP